MIVHKFRITAKHINCESTDDENETENTLSINKLHIEKEYETTIESIYYQYNKDFNNFDEQSISQNMTDYTKQELKGSSSTNNIYQNRSNKLQPTKEKIWTLPLLLESPKNKNF